MRTTLALAFALVAAIGAAPRVARADATAIHNIVGNAEKKAVACKAGDSVVIAGNENTVAVTGPCDAVRVSGNNNKVSIDQAGVIETPGNKNTVTWHGGLAGKDPKVSSLGEGNTVTKSK